MALTYTIWNSARPSKAPASIFSTPILFNCFLQLSFTHIFYLQDLKLVQAVEGVRANRGEMVIAKIPAKTIMSDLIGFLK